MGSRALLVGLLIMCSGVLTCRPIRDNRTTVHRMYSVKGSPTQWSVDEFPSVVTKFDRVHASADVETFAVYESQNGKAMPERCDTARKVTLYFRGTTGELNSFLRRLAAEVDKPQLTARLVPEPGRVRAADLSPKTKPGNEVKYNWSLEKTEYRKGDGARAQVYITVTIHVHGNVERQELELPLAYRAKVEGRLRRFADGHNARRENMGRSETSATSERGLNLDDVFADDESP